MILPLLTASKTRFGNAPAFANDALFVAFSGRGIESEPYFDEEFALVAAPAWAGTVVDADTAAQKNWSPGRPPSSAPGRCP